MMVKVGIMVRHGGSVGKGTRDDTGGEIGAIKTHQDTFRLTHAVRPQSVHLDRDAPTCRACRTSNNGLSHVTRGQNTPSRL